jgi:2-haloacid dehalogenase
VADRWATFDCYGTLVDWNAGIRAQLARLFGESRADALLHRYHEVEPAVEREEPSLPYRVVAAKSLARLGEPVPSGEEDALAESLPAWPVFPEVPAALRTAHERGWKLCILSNTDRDLLETSMRSIGAPFDHSIVASEIGSYKPALGHWRAFEREVGRLPDVHVAASLFHDVGPALGLGIPTVWVNRLAESPEPEPTRELTDLSRLAETLDELAPA